MQLRTCNACKQEKKLTEFSKNYKAGNFRYVEGKTYKNICKACNAQNARDWRKKNPGYKSNGRITKYPKEERLLLSAIRLRLSQAKIRTKKCNYISSDLDVEYLYKLFKKQNGKCKYTNTPLLLIKAQHTTLSLDKINPNKGYLKGNVQWLAWVVNRAKGDMSEELFLKMCKVITTKCNDYPEKEYT